MSSQLNSFRNGFSRFVFLKKPNFSNVCNDMLLTLENIVSKVVNFISWNLTTEWLDSIKLALLVLTFKAPMPQNSQTLKQFDSRRIVWVCLTIFFNNFSLSIFRYFSKPSPSFSAMSFIFIYFTKRNYF